MAATEVLLAACKLPVKDFHRKLRLEKNCWAFMCLTIRSSRYDGPAILAPINLSQLSDQRKRRFVQW